MPAEPVFVQCISHQQVMEQYSWEGAMDTMPAPDHPCHQQNWLPFQCSQAVSDEELLPGVVILIEGINDPLSPTDTSGSGPTLPSIVLHIFDENY